jgi:peptidyl-prolyl cis-trans isomerase C
MKIKTIMKNKLYTSLLLSIFLGITIVRAETPPDATILIQDSTLKVTKKEALAMLEEMTPLQRKRMLAHPDKFKGQLIDWLILKKKVAAAKKLKIDQQKLIQWKIEKAENRILARQLIVQYRNNIALPKEIELLAKEYYDAHPEDYQIEEKIKIAHILLSTRQISDKNAKAEKRKALEKIVEQLQKGDITFEEAAKKHSDDTGSAKLGGTIDYFTRGKMVKPFENAAFNLKKKDDLSQIIETQFGYHIIKLLDRKEQSTQPYAKVKEQLIQKEKSKYIKSKVKAYSDTFRVNKETTIYQQAINDLISHAN